MASTPPHRGTTYGGDGGAGSDPARRWTGRARVGAPSGSRVPGAASGRTYGSSTYGSSRGPSGPPPRSAPPARGRGGPRWGRIAVVGLIVVAVLAGVGVLAGYLWVNNVNDGLRRSDPFSQIADRPQKLVDGTRNILLLGTDSRDPEAPIETPGEWRADTIVIMHIPASHDKAYIVSIPRDTWTHVPRSADGQAGDTMAKINAAYAWGGMPLMVQTVEEFTGVRMDNVVLIDFAGFVKVVDALGGVDMTVEQSIDSIHEPYRHYNAGPNHLTGEEALDYVRQRYQFPNGDFDRIRHQHEFLKALLDKAVSAGTVSNPGAFKGFVSSLAGSMTVDQDFSLLDLGWQFRGLRSKDLVFVTSPNLGSDTIDGQSVVVSDQQTAASLFDAMARDTMAQWVAQHPDAVGG